MAKLFYGQRTPTGAGIAGLRAALASSDLSPTLPSDCPVQITRLWAVESGRLVLRFELKNRTSDPVQIGALSNIDQEGFASVAFHSFPSTLKWDAYSGDYGPNFYGHALNTATHLINHPEFGWQAFGGNVRVNGEWINVKPLDSFRSRVYLAPRGLWLTLDAGTFEAVMVNRRTGVVRIGLSSATPFTAQARLRVEQPAHLSGVGNYHPRQSFKKERDAYRIPLKNGTIWVELIDRR